MRGSEVAQGEADLSGGEARGDVVLRSPLAHDMNLSPTRGVVGIEDPFLQSPEAPIISTPLGAREPAEGGGRTGPKREAVALIVNSAVLRNEFIHQSELKTGAQPP